MIFVGREAELRFLEDRYNAQGGQLVILYGRRRIGKTETLRQFCKGKPHLFYSCTQTTDAMQLQKFSTQLLREYIPDSQYVTAFADWEKVFRALLELPYGEAKKLVVIDEFPYMCRSNASIPSILQNLWDELLKDSNVMLILCGSALSFMEKELLAEKNPLYGRTTGIYKMQKMGFYDAVRFFPGYSDRDKVLAYAILGGVPHYLKQWNPDWTVAENVQRNILTKGCVLYSEIEFLLHQELRETPMYNAIIETIALGSTRLNEISQKALIDNNSKTSVYLRSLLELGLVERVFPVDAGAGELANSSRGMYRLADHFFRFWYTFCFGNISQLEDGDVAGVYRYVVEPALHEFAAAAFEEICQEYVRGLQMQGRLPFRCARLGRWWGKTTVRDERAQGGIRHAETEIDLLGMSGDAKKYLVGACKFKRAPFRYADYLNTRAKLQALQEKAQFYYAFFSESGFAEKVQELAGEDVRLFSLHEIVNLPPGDGERK